MFPEEIKNHEVFSDFSPGFAWIKTSVVARVCVAQIK